MGKTLAKFPVITIVIAEEYYEYFIQDTVT